MAGLKKKHKKKLEQHDAVLNRLCSSLNAMHDRLCKHRRDIDDLMCRIDEVTPALPEFGKAEEAGIRGVIAQRAEEVVR